MNKYFNIYDKLETLIEKYGFCQEKYYIIIYKMFNTN